MAFGLNFSNMLPDAKAKLAERVTQAIASAPPTETATIQMMGQVIDYQLSQYQDSHLVDVNVNGSTDPVTGDQNLTFSVRARNTAAQTTQPQNMWTPSNGPISFKTADTSAPATPVAAPAPAPTGAK